MHVARFRRDEGLWLAGISILTAASWVRWVATGSPKVDENYPTEPVGVALLAALVVGWALLVWGWRGLLLRPVANPRRLAFTGLGVASAMLPLLSNDIFSLITYGSLAAHGRDVYTTASALPDSVFFPFIGEHWNRKVCVYGPTTLLAILPAGLGGSNPWVAMAILRGLWLVPLVLVMRWSFRRLPDNPFFHTMVWLNPIWVLEGPGQLHADLLGVVLVVAGVVAQQRGRPVAGWVCWALATLGKYSFAFTGFWYWLSGARTTRERLLRLPAIAAVLVGLGVAFFAPFWRGPDTLQEPIRALAAMNPGGSMAEVMGHVVRVLRGGAIPKPETPIRVALEIDRATKGPTWAIVSLVMRIVALGAGARLLHVMLKWPRHEGRIAMGTGALCVAAITLASHRFQAWYLLAALPFFGLYCTPVWRRWWIAMVAVSVTPDFTHVLPVSAKVLPTWSAVSTGACVLLFLFWFRGRYWAIDRDEAVNEREAERPREPRPLGEARDVDPLVDAAPALRASTQVAPRSSP
jgi:hypothetical protein